LAEAQVAASFSTPQKRKRRITVSTKQVIIEWGQDTPAYASQTMEVPNDATDEQIIAMAKAKADDVGDLVFDPSWDWTGLRIVSITESKKDRKEYIATDIPIDVSPFDFGQAADSAVRGRSKLSQITNEAARQGIAISPEVAAALTFADERKLMVEGVGVQDFKPFKLVIATIKFDATEDRPKYACVEVTPNLLRQIADVAAVGSLMGLTETIKNASAHIWQKNACIDMNRTVMGVLPPTDGDLATTRFYFRAGDRACETPPIRLLDVLRIASDATAPVAQGYMRQDGVIFYSGGDLEGLVRCYVQDHADADPDPAEKPAHPQGDWVIYHALQPNGERFWSEEDGWTCLAGATRYAEMPTGLYPMGGPENTQAGALCIGTMRPFTVMISGSAMGTAYAFDCFAESESHAVEQAENAYPEEQVQWVCLTASLDI
jgi:hypothetical protein